MYDTIAPAMIGKPTVSFDDFPVKICSEITAKELLGWNIRIPDYQRPYSWREKNVRDFLVDISLWQTDENKSGIPYHLGTIILKEQKGKNGEVYFDVIDGQQRLTTLAIIANNKGKDIDAIITEDGKPLICDQEENNQILEEKKKELEKLQKEYEELEKKLNQKGDDNSGDS